MDVRNCDSVKTIFDVKCKTQDTLITFPLKKLFLSELPNLERIWNEDPHGILSMQFLQEIYVSNCKCLTSVFPPSIVRDFEELQILYVENCEVLMAIVAEANPSDPQGTNPKFTFPGLTTLTLWDLPNFKRNDATPTFEVWPFFPSHIPGLVKLTCSHLFLFYIEIFSFHQLSGFFEHEIHTISILCGELNL